MVYLRTTTSDHCKPPLDQYYSSIRGRLLAVISEYIKLKVTSFQSHSLLDCCICLTVTVSAA